MKRFLNIIIPVFILLIILASCETTQTDNTADTGEVTDQKVSEAVKRYDFGKEYLKNKSWEAAIKNFEMAIKDSSGFMDAYIGLGKAYEGKMYYQQAESVYVLTVSKFKNPSGHVALGYMYTKLKEYNKAMTSFRNALNLDDENAAAYFGLGKVYKAQKEGKEGILKALPCFEKACQFNPDDLAAAYEYGKLLLDLEEYKKAQEFLSKVVDDHPNFVEPVTKLAEAYLESKEYKKAIEAYNKSLLLDSTQINTYLGIARSYQGLKDYTAAEKQYLKVAQINPSLTLPYLYIAQMYAGTKNYDKAISSLNTAVSKNPRDADAYYLMAQCYFLKVNAEKAKKDDAERQKAYDWLDKSEQYFNKAVEISPSLKTSASKWFENIKKRRNEIDPDRW